MRFRVATIEVSEAVYKGLSNPNNFKAFVQTVLDKDWLRPNVDPVPTINCSSDFKGEALEMKYGELSGLIPD